MSQGSRRLTKGRVSKRQTLELSSRLWRQNPDGAGLRRRNGSVAQRSTTTSRPERRLSVSVLMERVSR
jgi:hypothetical protein